MTQRIPCTFCQRRFLPRNLSVHEGACLKGPNKAQATSGSLSRSRKEAGAVSFVLGCMLSILSLIAFCAEKFVNGVWAFFKLLPAAFNLFVTAGFFYCVNNVIVWFKAGDPNYLLLETALKQIMSSENYGNLVSIAHSVN